MSTTNTSSAAHNKLLRQRFEVPQTHVDRNGLVGLHQRLPIEVDVTVLAVAGHEHAGLGVVAMGQRNPGIGRRAGRGCNSGTNLKRNAVFSERFDLLATAPEHEGVTPLETQHALALARETHHQRANVGLRQLVVAWPLAHIDPLDPRRDEVHDAGVGEAIPEDDVGAAHQSKRTQRQQVGIARTGAHEIDLAHRSCRAMALACDGVNPLRRARLAPRADKIEKRRDPATAGRVAQMAEAGQQGAAHDSVMSAVDPEAPPYTIGEFKVAGQVLQRGIMEFVGGERCSRRGRTPGKCARRLQRDKPSALGPRVHPRVRFDGADHLMALAVHVDRAGEIH